MTTIAIENQEDTNQEHVGKTKKKEKFREVMWKGNDQYAETPMEVMMPLVQEFGLLQDVCPKDPQRNSLADDCEWEQKNYMNPPYSAIDAWMTKATAEWRKGKSVIALLPARTNTNWWHNYVIPYASEIRFVRQGIKFKGYNKKSPFPVAICVFKAEDAQYADSNVETRVGSVDFYEKKKKRKKVQ